MLLTLGPLSEFLKRNNFLEVRQSVKKGLRDRTFVANGGHFVHFQPFPLKGLEAPDHIIFFSIFSKNTHK